MLLKKILFAATFLSSTAAFAQTTKLVLTKGQKFEVTTTMNTSSLASMMGQEMESSLDNTTIEFYEVKDTRASETDLVKIVTKMKMNTQMMGQDMSYDSDSKNNSGPMVESMDKMVGKIKNITIDTNGKIIKQEKDAEEDVAQVGMMMGASSSDGVAMLKPSFINKKFAINSSWVDSTVNDADKLKSTTVGTYTVTGIEGNIASISFAGNQRMSGTIEQMGQEMAMTGTSKVNTQIKFDIASGLIIESTSTVDGTSNIDAMGMSIPVTTKTTSTTKVKTL